MAGLQILDTYGELFGVDQMCDCEITDDLQVGDCLALDTDAGELFFTVAVIEHYDGCTEEPSEVIGVGLVGDFPELVMPGDTLRRIRRSDPASTELETLNLSVGDNLLVEIRRELAVTTLQSAAT